MISNSVLRQKLERPASRFQSLGNLTRLAILYTLARDPLEFGRLRHRLKLPPSLLSHHLTVLLRSGWVTKTKVGKFVTYYVGEDSIKGMTAFLQKLLM